MKSSKITNLIMQFNKSTQGFGHDECYISQNDGSILVYPKLYTKKSNKKNFTSESISETPEKIPDSCIIL